MVKWSWSQGHDVEQHSRAENYNYKPYTSVVSNERLQGRKRCLDRGEDIKPTGAPRFLRSVMALADTR